MSARAAVAAAIAAAACASAGPASPPGPPPFQGVASVLLVRPAPRDPSAARPRDALDALQESLEGAGRTVRVVELGPRLREDLAPLARLQAHVEARAGAGPFGAPAGRGSARLDRRDAAAIREAGVDAAALLVRFERRPLPPMAPPGGPMFAEPPRPAARPAGALALVDRDGHLVWFEWGAGAGAPGDRGPPTAADAVNEAVRVLLGRPDGEE
ncbi:hypothetical protein ACOQFB_00200 [Anaeromyxobacter sp. Red801]|uniref:hypothetical protein n=1 Tax=Anaeromyxobacter sp. Red801 TaxID=3411632 RepID=UPI003BA0EF52